MSTGELLSIEPIELKFPFELRKQISCSLQLSNKTDNYVAFKVKTTNPKKYCVRPNTGIVLPRSTCDIIVTMQAQKEAPLDMQCKDKFLLQSVKVNDGVTTKDITPEMFNKEAGHMVEECKLRVLYVSPPQPPSPVPEGSEEGSSPRGSVSENGNADFATSTKAFEPQDKSAEAKSLISRLTEEKNNATQENNRLRQELELLRRAGHINRGGSGVSFMIVILVGLIGAPAAGARKYPMLGVYLQRSWIVMFLASIILLLIFIFATQILEVLGQDEDVAKVGGEVAHWIIGAMFALVISYSSQMYLQSQSKNMLITYFAALAILIHVLLSWLLTVKYNFGVPGAMLSTVLAFWIPNIGQLMFIMCGGCRETWKGFSLLAFQDLWAVMKLSLSSGVMLCVEVWYNAVLLLIAGYLKNAEVSIDALSICLSINGWEMMIALGFMSTASVRVSNELGRGSAKAAKFSIVMTGLTSFTIGFVLFLFFLIFRGRVAYVFTEDEEVALAFANMSPFLAVSVLLNSIQPVLSGVAIGAGLQSIVAYVNLTAYYLVGIPVGAVLGFVFDMEVKGVWIGMLFGTFVQTVVLIIMTYKTNWDEQVIIARNRVNRWTVKDGNEPDHTT